MYRKRFFFILAFFNFLPIVYAIKPLLKNSANSEEWYLSIFFMFIGSFGSSLNFGVNYLGVERGFVLNRFCSSCSIKKIIYSKIILSSSIFLVVSFMYSILIFNHLSQIPSDMVLLFFGYFVFLLSLLPVCFSYLSIKHPSPTYSNWLYPNRKTISLVSGFQNFFVVLFPLSVPLILFYALEQNEYSALLLILALSFANFAFAKKLIDKSTEAFYKDRMDILNKISREII